MNSQRTLVLVDGSALAFRSFFGLFTSGMRASDGTPTWAVFGFLRAIFDVLEKRKPDMIAVCFDMAAPTFRHEEFKEYKAHRAEMPDDLSVQWPIIKRGVEVLGIPLYELAGWEADDIIGTVAKEAGQQNMQVLILTGDQDAFQLLDDHTQVLMPAREGGLASYGRQEVFDKLGIWPEQVIDYKGLCGDTSDNIPGVKGIGPKTAQQLLSQFETLENVYANLNTIKSASVKQKLQDGRDSAFSSKGLATIRLDVPLDFDFAHCCLNLPPVESVAAFMKEMQFNSMLKQLPRTMALFNNGVAPKIDESLLLPPSKASRVQPVLAAVSASGVETEPESASAWSGQLSLFASPSIQQDASGPLIIRTRQELENLIREVSKQSVLALELETEGTSSLETSIVGYCLGWTAGLQAADKGRFSVDSSAGKVKTAYIPVRHPGEEQLAPELVCQALKPLLQDLSVGKVAQNAKFKMNALSLEQINFGPLVFDPLIASYIENPDEKHGLKEQAQRLLGYDLVDMGESAGKKKSAPREQIPAAQAALRAGDQAMVTLELAKFWRGRFDEQQDYLLFEMDLPLVAVLAKMEQAGIALDLPYLDEFSKELNQELLRLEAEIYELAGHPFNINSTQQLAKVLFEELHLPSKGKTKSGFSTDASVLEAIAKEHPLVPKILEYRQDSKLRSTYVDVLPKLISPHDGRLHGEFNQITTSTGRLSSLNPNLQNIPIRTELGRRIRRAIVSGSESCLLLAADYSQIELRMLAHMCGDELLIDAFEKNQDIHARTAGEIFEVKLEDVTPEMRRVGKTLNFALIYQQGAYSTAQSLGISPKEAQGFIDKYFSRYPKVRQFLVGSIEETRQKGYCSTIWGRRRYFRHLNDRNDVVRRAEERAACNAPIQGSAADLMKLAMIRLDRALHSRKLSGRLILQVHDELVLEVPESQVEETSQVVVEAMSQVQEFKVPLRVDLGVGKNWIEVKG